MCSSTWNSNHHKNEDEESGHNKSNNNNNNSNSIDHHVHNNYTNNILNDDENLHISRRYEQQDYHNDDRNVSNHIHQTNLRLALEAAFRPGQEQQEANDVINITDDVKSHVDWDVVNEILRNLVNLPSSSDSSLTSSSLLSEVDPKTTTWTWIRRITATSAMILTIVLLIRMVVNSFVNSCLVILHCTLYNYFSLFRSSNDRFIKIQRHFLQCRGSVSNRITSRL
mmetsp:Transcript_41748/g.100175  ORF Transcript_41748/g.100175 Transcript_41748/m.100175 type:complete len:225 (+) Transcript_41748:228-902(+)